MLFVLYMAFYLVQYRSPAVFRFFMAVIYYAIFSVLALGSTPGPMPPGTLFCIAPFHLIILSVVDSVLIIIL